jgi:hypothetical protein
MTNDLHDPPFPFSLDAVEFLHFGFFPRSYSIFKAHERQGVYEFP